MDRDYKVSIIVPVWNGMDNSIQLLERNLRSIINQNYKAYEIIVSDDSDDNIIEDWLRSYSVKYFKNSGEKGMANNTNHAIDKASGELVKILFQDDYFYNQDSLHDITKHFTGLTNWLVTGCIHTFNGKTYVSPHIPYYSESENTIGSPSVVTFRKELTERFDPQFHWVLDIDLYKRFFRKYGKPKILNNINVAIGLHSGQMTNKLSDQRKMLEEQLLKNKYV